jgi:hypothetical protein
VDERAEASVAARFGSPGSLTLFGVGLSRETLEFGDFPGDLQVAVANAFNEPIAAPAGVMDEVGDQTVARSTTRLSLMVGQRNLRFIRARGLDNLNGVQDLQLGTDIGLTLGRSIDVLSKDGLPSTDDLYTRLLLFAGFNPGSSYIFSNLTFEGRRLTDYQGTDGPWRDFLAEGDVYGYLRGADEGNTHTLFARVSAAGGWSMVNPFQLSLGGRSGVRGFAEEDFPGAQRILFTLEDRIFLGWPAPDVVDLGLSVFADAGRVWAGDVPYGMDSGWKASVGVGIRYGFPAGSRGLARMDIAFPVGVDSGSPVFRLTVMELNGIWAGFEDDQMRRSRRNALGPDRFVTEGR